MLSACRELRDLSAVLLERALQAALQHNPHHIEPIMHAIHTQYTNAANGSADVNAAISQLPALAALPLRPQYFWPLFCTFGSQAKVQGMRSLQSSKQVLRYLINICLV